MPDRVLVLNAGSSSLKFGLYSLAGADPVLERRGQIAGIGAGPSFRAVDAAGAVIAGDGDMGGRLPGSHDAALAFLLDWLDAGDLVGAGHRVVHGGTEFVAPIRLDRAVTKRLAALGPLAPHHQPHNLAAIEALFRRAPDLPQVACFDTAFHASQPELARRLTLPRAWRRRGLQRYGFHGLSYESVVATLRDLNGGRLPRRLVIAHLGNGASMCAVLEGRGVATTMGFSTLDGLVMGTRCGSLDPGVVIHLMREGLDLAAIEDLLYNQSGLLGLSGLSADMKLLLASPAPEAASAIAQYCYRLNRELGSLAAALGGLDALVFTGGVGENAPAIRAAVCRDAAWLGVTLDEAANARGGPLIGSASAPVSVWAVPTDEERVIARQTRTLLGL
jgi:acetate kinase